MKKALQLASVASMIDQFNIPNIELLLHLGFFVDVVADYTNPGNISHERTEELKEKLKAMGANPVDISIPRSLNPFAIRRAYKQVSDLIKKEGYDLIHCHSPIGGAITRLAGRKARKNGTKIIYTAHGFHFFDGAPFRNWLLYYPVEKYLSRYTDVLITINKEDYHRAKTKLKAKETVYIPGIGIDVDKFKKNNCGLDIRRELGVTKEDVLLLSVGELNNNKNHEVIVNAFVQMKRQGILPDDLFYIIIGIGKKEEELKKLIAKNGLGNKVRLIGYRSNIEDYYNATNILVFPSIREGLGLAGIEGMASGLPLIVSDNRGTRDFADEKGSIVCKYNDIQSFADAILNLRNNPDRCLEMGRYNQDKSKAFDIVVVEREMKKLYTDIESKSIEQ